MRFQRFCNSIERWEILQQELDNGRMLLTSREKEQEEQEEQEEQDQTKQKVERFHNQIPVTKRRNPRSVRMRQGFPSTRHVHSSEIGAFVFVPLQPVSTGTSAV